MVIAMIVSEDVFWLRTFWIFERLVGGEERVRVTGVPWSQPITV